MAKKPSLRFEHREVALIFLLFVFTSLLMFTVGILVGKGITQAKYEGTLPFAKSPAHVEKEVPAETGHPSEQANAKLSPPEHAKEEIAHQEKEARKPSTESKNVESEEMEDRRAPQARKSLDLVPAEKPRSTYAGLQEPNKDADKVLKNPKMKGVVEDAAPPPKRQVASIPPRKAAEKLTGYLPRSFNKGEFTVQVGSYSTEKEANERVENLKTLGFPYAFEFSKDGPEKKHKWFRVYLGYYFEFDSAKQSGELLQKRGEVKNYLVRKADDIK